MDVASNDASILNAMFNKIILDLKNSSPVWEDFLSKSNKLHNALKNVLLCSTVFWEAFQKIADLATDAQGATKEIGASFTRLCMRQRLMESKLKTLNNHLIGSLANPVQDKLEEWKRYANQLDKDRIKETKKAKADWKKATGESVRLQKKAVKRGSMRGLGSLQNQVEGALKNTADKYASLQYVESVCLRRAMTHERERFCFLFSCMKPVLECQISLLTDISSLDELMKTLTLNTVSPDRLPIESEEIIQQIIDPELVGSNKTNCNVSGNTVFSSGFGSRKSSVASLNSHQSFSSGCGPSSTTMKLSSRYSDVNLSNYGTLRSLRPYERGSITSIFHSSVKYKKGEMNDTNLGASYLSMTSSMQEASGCSGDYRVSDDDSKKNSSEIEKSGEDESDDEEDEIEDEDEEEESEEDVKTPSSPSASLWSEKLNPSSDVGPKFVASRHTISGTSIYTRPALSPGVFEPLNKMEHRSDATLPKMDQSKQLYPNQAIPLPVYTNLQELTNAAQRKFSMQQQQYIPEPSELDFDSVNSTLNLTNSATDHYVSPSGSKTPGLRRMTLPEVMQSEKDSKNQNHFLRSKAFTLRDWTINENCSEEEITPSPSPKLNKIRKSKTFTPRDFLNSYTPNILYSNIPIRSPANCVQKSNNPLQQPHQISTLTRPSESHHINCSQVSRNHHRSTSLSENNYEYENVELNNASVSQAIQNNLIANNRSLEVHYFNPSQEHIINELNQQIKRQKSVPSAVVIPEIIPSWTDIDPDLPMPPPPSTAEEEIRLASIPIPNRHEVMIRHCSSPNV